MSITPSAHTSSSSAAAGPGRSAGWFWPLLIIGLLGGHALLWVTMLLVSASDRSFAIEPDYYQKSLHWNDAAAQAATNRRLGWTLHWTFGAPDGPLPQRRLACRLVNVDGRPLDGASVQVELFSHTCANERVRVVLEPRGDGVYETRFNGFRPGLLELRTTVQRGPETFTETVQIDVSDSR